MARAEVTMVPNRSMSGGAEEPPRDKKLLVMRMSALECRPEDLERQ